MSSGGDELEEITVRLRGLNITIRADDPGSTLPSSSASFSVVSLPEPAEPAPSAARDLASASDLGPHPSGPLAGEPPLAAGVVTELANRLQQLPDSRGSERG